MTDAAAAIQTAAVQALKASADVSAIVGPRVYDRVPDGARFPYVSYGEDQLIEDDAECLDGFECFVTLHGWSREVGQIEAKRLAGAMRAALHNASLTITDHRLHSIEHDSTRFLRDPDGLTSHAVVTFRAVLDPL